MDYAVLKKIAEYSDVYEVAALGISSVEEMNRDIICKWNSVVSTNDIVFHLGDFGFGT